MNNNNNITPPLPIEGFHTVEMMREIREKLSEKYWQRNNILKQDMEAVRKKYNFNVNDNKNASN